MVRRQRPEGAPRKPGVRIVDDGEEGSERAGAAHASRARRLAIRRSGGTPAPARRAATGTRISGRRNTGATYRPPGFETKVGLGTCTGLEVAGRADSECSESDAGEPR